MLDRVPSSEDPGVPGSPLPAIPGAPAWLRIRDLGRVSYGVALELQRGLQTSVREARERGEAQGHLLLLEHDPPVITVSRRPGAAANVLADPETLRRAGVERHETDRGGDVTYHGPGQLVAYPIVDLERIGLRIHGWIRLLEDAIVACLADFGVPAGTDPGATGVWVDRSSADADGQGGRKIAAIGVRVSRWVTLHGLALNVSPDLNHFRLIVPCGLVGRPVTSIAREQAVAPDLAAVKRSLALRLAERLSAAEVATRTDGPRG